MNLPTQNVVYQLPQKSTPLPPIGHHGQNILPSPEVASQTLRGTDSVGLWPPAVV